MEPLQHFARSLRPRKLADVIGQDFVVSMLQNSIYLGRFFPVYLFHGQRGCGKTTVARIIAAMINCLNLENFRKNPRTTTLPCLECPSCIATAEGNHPDFIEIDAASHTGVDHVRTILESAHYLPLMGRKKIYLIDEAHMLSKAAFNALLKMLEEPPAQALFILATTEIAKIPTTVRSRSFQGIFNAPEHAIVAKFLTNVATSNKLTLTPGAADLIVTKADRCVRDALNLLEQLGAIHAEVTEETVTKALGIPDKKSVLEIVEAVIKSDHTKLFEALLNAKHSEKNPTTFWQTLSEAFQSLIRIHFKSPGIGIFASHESELKGLLPSTNSQQLAFFNSQFWIAERTFNITAHKVLFIEHFLSSLCAGPSQPETTPQPMRQNIPQKPLPQGSTSAPIKSQSSEPQTIKPHAIKQNVPIQDLKTEAPAEEKQPQNPSWSAFLAELSIAPDKIAFGIFKQAKPLVSDSSLTIEIINLNSFLEEQLNERATLWKPLLKKHLSEITKLEIKPAPAQTAVKSDKTVNEGKQNPTISSRALAEGPTTDLIMRYFPGKLI